MRRADSYRLPSQRPSVSAFHVHVPNSLSDTAMSVKLKEWSTSKLPGGGAMVGPNGSQTASWALNQTRGSAARLATRRALALAGQASPRVVFDGHWRN